jgi:hypothetical protein
MLRAKAYEISHVMSVQVRRPGFQKGVLKNFRAGVLRLARIKTTRGFSMNPERRPALAAAIC